jgi:hypothetical protein
MYLILKRAWEVNDASKPHGQRKTTIPAGRHEVEEIPNPLGFPNAPWLVLKGTLIGSTKGFWKQWKDYNDDFQVVVETDSNA